ncbi:EAL domain-containing protein [Aureimonas leprariae]|uniref:EAL domain-containing protein n=2 Tax=Plantimonas leprariae TaxID=2615207 RepID=A0A7V7PLU5_9HYPH|nr:EAL domain-containing protein [Aureimonas leprariae]
MSVERALSFYPEDARAAISAGLEAAAATGTPYDLTVPFTDAAGRSGWVRTIGQWQETGGIRRIVGVIEDVTAEKTARDRLQDLVYIDALTGLPNRRAFEMRLAEIEEAMSQRANAALLLVDIDHFKTVNDTFGHPAGDRLLQEIASRLRHCVRATDTVARIGGDEFAVLLSHVPDAASLEGKASQILEAVRQTIQTGDDTLYPTASIGVSHLAFASNVDGLLKCADLALYRAKALGRNRAETFSPELRRRTDQDARVLDAIRHAIDRDEIVAFYQPIVDLKTCQVRGLEALARWNHPICGILPPSEFAAALEDPVLSMAIDDAVLRQALRQMREWVAAGVPVAAVNVNASEAQLRRADLVERVAELLDLNQLTPDRLKIELVETAYLGRDPQQIVSTVQRLAKLGMVCALDDFGTGHASLTHLRQLRVDRVKIDRSFVANMCTEPFDRGLVKSLVELGRNLGIRMTAEGVETTEQLELLRAFGCDCAQGYLIGRPMPAEQVPEAALRWYASCAADGRIDASDRSLELRR